MAGTWADACAIAETRIAIAADPPWANGAGVRRSTPRMVCVEVFPTGHIKKRRRHHRPAGAGAHARPRAGAPRRPPPGGATRSRDAKRHQHREVVALDLREKPRRLGQEEDDVEAEIVEIMSCATWNVPPVLRTQGARPTAPSAATVVAHSARVVRARRRRVVAAGYRREAQGGHARRRAHDPHVADEGNRRGGGARRDRDGPHQNRCRRRPTRWWATRGTPRGSSRCRCAGTCATGPRSPPARGAGCRCRTSSRRARHAGPPERVDRHHDGVLILVDGDAMVIDARLALQVEQARGGVDDQDA